MDVPQTMTLPPRGEEYRVDTSPGRVQITRGTIGPILGGGSDCIGNRAARRAASPIQLRLGSKLPSLRILPSYGRKK